MKKNSIKLSGFQAVASNTLGGGCADASSIATDCTSFAVADGVSESGVISGLLAQTLCDLFVSYPHNVEYELRGEPQADAPASVRWAELRESLKQRFNSEDLAEFFTKAACTFAGLMLSQDGSSPAKLTGILIGDCACFVIYPTRNFNWHTNMPNNAILCDGVPNQVKFCESDKQFTTESPAHLISIPDLLPGTIILLATDHLAKCIYTLLDDSQPAPNAEQFLDRLISVANRSGFIDWVEQARAAKLLVVDDCALVRIIVETNIATDSSGNENKLEQLPRTEPEDDFHRKVANLAFTKLSSRNWHGSCELNYRESNGNSTKLSLTSDSSYDRFKMKAFVGLVLSLFIFTVIAVAIFIYP